LFVFWGCEESVNAVGAAVNNMCVEEAGVHVAFGDSLLSHKGLLEAANIGKS
jgi:hypothetical protein